MMRPDPRLPRRTRRPALADELARLRHIERIAREFCARCERGEIRSVATYALFRAAIAGPGGDAALALGTSRGGTCARSDS